MQDTSPGIPTRSSYTIKLHRDLHKWLSSRREPRLQAQVRLNLLDLAARGYTKRVKSVSGRNKGWLRSPLSYGGASHYYLWWLGPAESRTEFAHETEIRVRAVRHHDETDDPLTYGDFESCYVVWSPRELIELDDPEDLPFKESQIRLARAASPVRTIRGLPGCGKTSGLLYAAALLTEGKVLYVTRNWRLARDATRYLEAFGATGEKALVLTFEDLLDRFEGLGLRRHRDSDQLDRFQAALTRDCRIDLGPWRSHVSELHGELYGHVIGRALPTPFRGRPAAKGLLLEPSVYEGYRASVLESRHSRVVSLVGEFLQEKGLLTELFPAPVGAATATLHLENGHRALSSLQGTTAVLVDEVQDLTLRELYFLVRLRRNLKPLGSSEAPSLLLAGDESQTVAPTFFSWGELADLTTLELGARVDHELDDNLRNASRIAELVARSWMLYAQIAKDDRPRGRGYSSTSPSALTGRVVHVACKDDNELAEVGQAIADLPNSILVYPGSSVPADRIHALDPAIDLLPATAVKGLEFCSVGILDAGRQLAAFQERTADEIASFSRPLAARTLADQIRVALSRATQNLWLIDVAPDEGARRAISRLGGDLIEYASGPDACLMLRRGEEDPVEALHLVAEAAEVLMENHPGMALRRSRLALEESSRLVREGAAPPAYLIRRLTVLRGVSAAMLAMAELPACPGPLPPSVMLEAVQALKDAGLEGEAHAVLATCQVRNPGTALHTTLGSVRTVLDHLAALHPLLKDRAVDALVAWCRQVDPVGGRMQPEERQALCGLLAELERHVAPSRPDVMTDVARIREVLQTVLQKEESVEEQTKSKWAEEIRQGEEAGHRGSSSTKKAEKCFRAALKLARDLGPDRGRLAVTLAKLGYFNRRRGLFAQAEKDLTQALTLMESEFNPRCSARLEAMRDLAGAIMSSKSTRRAEPWIRRVLEVTEELFGAFAEDLVRPLHWLARVLEDQGDPDQSLSCLSRAIAICDEVGTPLDASYEALCSDRVLMLETSGRHDEARIAREGLANKEPDDNSPDEPDEASSLGLIERFLNTGDQSNFSVGQRLIKEDPEGLLKLLDHVRSLSGEEIDRLGSVPGTNTTRRGVELTMVWTSAARLARRIGSAFWSADVKVLTALGEMLTDPSPAKRVLGGHLLAQILGAMGKELTIDPLLTMLGDPTLEVREAAVVGFGAMFRLPERGLVGLLQAACDSEARVRLQAMLALANAKHLGEIVVPRLTALLHTEDLESRAIAARALQFYSTEASEAVPHLMGLLDDPSEDLRGIVVGALASTSSPVETLHVAARALRDPAPQVREAACLALADLGRAGEPQLETVRRLAMEDADDRVRSRALEARDCIVRRLFDPDWLADLDSD